MAMLSAPFPDNEEQRLEKLYELDILDTLEEEAFDDLTHLAAHICGTPIALISLVDRDRQFLKSHYGFAGNSMPRDIGLCPHAILNNDLTIIEDTSKDQRFFDNPIVTGDPSVRFYAGAPLIFADDICVGTLCIVDHIPRSITEEQKNTLRVLAEQVITQLELRQKIRELESNYRDRTDALVKLQRSEAREQIRSSVLEQLAYGDDIEHILERIVLGIEQQYSEAQCSIQLYDKESHSLVHGSAPHLPRLFKDAVQKINISSGLTSAAQCALTKKRTIDDNMLKSKNWHLLKDVMVKTDITACWAEPILNSKGQLLATCSLYFKNSKSLDNVLFSDLKYAINLIAITVQRKQEEQELLRAKETAELVSEAKSEFLSSMSHELRTPLGAILGFAQLLESDTNPPLSSNQRENLEYILSSGRHLLSFINDLLDLSSIEAGKVELNTQNIDINDVVLECIGLSRVIAKQTDITLLFSGEHQTVRADRIKLKQILLNLIDNAIKYNIEAGSVEVKWYKTDRGTIRTEVKDTGIGIPTEQHKKLFTKFNRLAMKYSAVEGTGIGLELTKQLVELMDGKIGFNSQVNIGTTFWFELPTL